MDWKEQLNFGEPTYTEHKVGEKTLRFYPVSVGMVFELRRAAKPLAKAFATLTSGGKGDNSSVFREIGDPATDASGKPIKTSDGEFVRDTETISEAISSELASLRMEQRSQAVEDLISALSDDENVEIVVKMVCNSLKITDPPPAKEFLSHVPAPEFAQMIFGVAKANKGVLGPLGKKMEEMFGDQNIENAKENLRNNLKMTGQPEPRTSGEPSPKPSSSSQSEATTPTG